MKTRIGDDRALPVASFCRDGATLQGQWPLSGMTRLAAAFEAATDASVAWQLDGSPKPPAGGQAAPEVNLWLHLRAQATVPLQCQRCLGPVAQVLQVDRLIGFVRGEELAARLDEELDDDVLDLPARLDVHELLQDELILALPLVPRHDGDCPQPLAVPASDESPGQEPANEQPHPFAALAALKTGNKT